MLPFTPRSAAVRRRASLPPSCRAARAPYAHVAIAALALIAASVIPGSPIGTAPAAAQAPQLCKPGHNYDQAKGLCYDPGTAYKADIPKSEDATGGILSGIGNTLGLGGGLSLCQYGDKHVGSGDQAYCVNRRTGQAYPAGR